LLVVLRGQLRVAVKLAITGGKIVEINAIADPEHLRRLDLAVFGAPSRPT
jgi:hypothetical protein